MFFVFSTNVLCKTSLNPQLNVIKIWLLSRNTQQLLTVVLKVNREIFVIFLYTSYIKVSLYHSLILQPILYFIPIVCSRKFSISISKLLRSRSIWPFLILKIDCTNQESSNCFFWILFLRCCFPVYIIIVIADSLYKSLHTLTELWLWETSP